MAIRDTKTLDFIRELLRPRVTRPQEGIIIYPTTDRLKDLKIRVSDKSIFLYFGSTEQIITYSGNSIEKVVRDINNSGIPVKAIAASRALRLTDNDIIGTDEAKTIPYDFSIYDRKPNNGIVLRIPRLTVKYKSLSNIKVLPPYKEAPNLPWYPRISIGSFVAKKDGRSYHFTIPEYEKQEWSLLYGRPFKDVRGAKADVIEDGVLQVGRTPLHWNGQDIRLIVDGTPLGSSVIEDVDVYNGKIYLKPGVVISRDVSLDYSYLETSYVYKKININPHFTQNPNILSKFVVIYIVPSESAMSSAVKRAVYHSVGDSLEDAIDSIELTNPDMPIAILGAYSIGQEKVLDKVTILDTRVLGGGLLHPEGPKSPVHNLDDVLSLPMKTKEELKDRADTLAERNNFWDIGYYDGDPYPGAAAVILGIPDHTRLYLQDKDIKAKAAKFLAAGVYPVADFYDSSISGTEENNVSALLNGSFSGSGEFWTPTYINIPSGTVLSPFDPSFDPKVITKEQEAGTILEVDPDNPAYQPYLKSSPDAIIEYERRFLTESADITDPQDKYTEWERIRITDSRDVDNRQLIRGEMVFSTEVERMQVRDVKIFSPVYSYEILDNLSGDIKEGTSRILNTLSGYSDSNAFRNVKVTDISTLSTESITSIIGLPESVGILFRASEIPLVSGEIDHYTDAWKTIFSGVSSTNLLRQYSSGSYSDVQYTGENIISTIEGIAYTSSYLLEVSGSTSDAYASGLATMKTLYTTLTENNSWSYIPHSYTWDGSVLSGNEIKISTAPEEISSDNKDYELVDSLPPLMKMWEALYTYSGNVIGELSGLPESVFNAWSYAYGRAEKRLFNPPLYSGSPAANHWFSPYNKYYFLGKLMDAGMDIVESLINSRNRTSETPTYSGSDDTALAYYHNSIDYILSKAYPLFRESLSYGGIMHQGNIYLASAYAKYAYRGIVLNERPYSDNEDLDNYLKLAKEYVYTAIKSYITTEGEFVERPFAANFPIPASGNLPTKIIETLGLVARMDTGAEPLLLGVFNTLSGVYENSGVYPVDPILVDSEGGMEEKVAHAFLNMYKYYYGERGGEQFSYDYDSVPQGSMSESSISDTNIEQESIKNVIDTLLLPTSGSDTL